MNYQRYVEVRILDISYIRSRLRRLFGVLTDADFDAIQRLLAEAELILRKYVVGENK